ncbi:MAG: hypothetical protein AAGM40_21685 [Cyanobacteria bacterium J06573_2]
MRILVLLIRQVFDKYRQKFVRQINDERSILKNSVVERDAVFAISQVEQASKLPSILGCPMEDGAFGPYIKTDNFKATPIPGLYAAGDAARQMHNATWATSDGVTAGIFTHQSLVKSVPQLN